MNKVGWGADEQGGGGGRMNMHECWEWRGVDGKFPYSSNLWVAHVH